MEYFISFLGGIVVIYSMYCVVMQSIHLYSRYIGKNYVTGQMKIVIIDHYSRTVYSNLQGKQAAQTLSIELQLRNSEARDYIRMPLTASSKMEIPETIAHVTRFNNTYWIDILGDYIP